MAAVSPVASVEGFLDALEKSQLLAATAVAEVRRAAERRGDPRQLARELVKAGTLTKWQAAQLLHGYHTLVVGKYKLLEQLGSGALGRVYLAEHAQMARRHTLKIVSRRYTQDREGLKRFLAEAQRACGLEHRNLSRIYDVNTDGERFYLVMEYVEGEDLEQQVGRKGRLSCRRACDFAGQIAEGLAHAHEQGVVHGDLKPSNLIVDGGGTVRILDIGQAQLVGQPPSPVEESGESASLATALFQAPEQRGEARSPDRPGDVYSLGSVLCYLLTGRTAADAEQAAAQLKKVEGIAAEVVELCVQMLADDPAKRPQSMAAIAERLARFAVPAPSSSAAAPKKDDSFAGKLSMPKAKKPPVARPLTDDAGASGAVVAADDEQSAKDDSPFAGFKLDTDKRGKKAAAKPAAPAVAAAKEPVEQAAAAANPKQNSSRTVLIVAGVAGGGVLVLGTIAALVVFFALRGRADRQVAEAAPVQSAPVPSAAAAADVAAMAEEANPAEANPQLLIVPAEAPGEALPDNSPPAEEPPVEAAANEAPEPAPPPAVAEPKPAAESEPPAAAKAKAAPPPAKAAPRAEEDPFKGFAKAVSLPVLPEGSEPEPDVMAPTPLGPCKVPPSALVIAHLKGGESAFRSRHKFELEAVNGTALQDWEVRLIDGTAARLIATLGVKEGQLVFQWTPEAASQPALANMLCNCALQLSAGPKQIVVPLRKPIEGPPLAFDLNRPQASVRWPIEFLPDAKQIYVEAQKLDTAHQRIQPEEGTPVGGDVTIWTGPADDALYLALKCEPQATTRYVEVRGTALLRIEGLIPRPKAFNRRELGGALQQADKQIAVMTVASRQAQDAEQNAEKKARLRAASEQQIAAIATQAEKLRRLMEFTGELSPSIHFRVYYLAEDQQVDLLITKAEDRPAEERRPAKKGKAEKGKAAETSDLQ